MPNSVSRVHAANVDGRARNPIYIQEQLSRLHAALVTNVQDIQQAISIDSGNSSAEVGIEYCLSLASLKEQYQSIDPEETLADEYAIAKDKDAPSRRMAAGIVYIVPSAYTLFYSVVTSLSAAIAAGNCVILELKTTISEVKAVLRNLLPQALDDDTFSIVESRPENEALPSSCIQVFGTQINDQIPTANQLISPSTARVIALIDRTADIDNAASALVKARFSFGGHSPYSPDLVLVNEFVMSDFKNAVVEKAAKCFAKRVGNNENFGVCGKRREFSKVFAEEKLKEDGSLVVVSSEIGSIIDVKDRASGLLQLKITEPHLLIHPITSLDDGIDFSNRGDEPLLASFIFAAPPAAKYVSQFVDSYVSCVNGIPVELLVGPASPIHHAPSLRTRYTRSMFEVPRPQFIQFTGNQPEILNRALAAAEPDLELQNIAVAPLPALNRLPGKSIGFFEQGLLAGVTAVIVPVVTGMVVLGYYGIRAAVRGIRG